MKTGILMTTVALLAAGTLAGCGGSSGSARLGGAQVTGVISAIDTSAPAGAASNRKTRILVNDVDYTLDENVNIQVEDAPADPSILAEGQVVTMETATDDNGENLATAIYLADEVEGVVFGDVTPSGMNVMGLNVTFTDSTRFAWHHRSTPVAPTDIGHGWVVEVHGFPSSNGIVATRVEVKSNDYQTYRDEFELKGTISAVSADIITIGSQQIGITSTTDTRKMPSQRANWVGMYVEVETDRNHIFLGDTIAITATEIEPEERESHRDHDDYDEVEIHGIFTYVNGVARVNGDIVRVSDRIPVQTLRAFDGEFVEVEGRYENGVLVVYEIERDDD